MEGFRLRKATHADREFAYQVRKLAFRPYIERIWGWDEAEQRQLHEGRFASQEFRVIEWLNVDIGILASMREYDSLKINQLFIHPDYQGKGFGAVCMRQIIDEAATPESVIRLKVLKVNTRAQVFFERLGFNTVGETDTHLLMERLA